MSYWVSYWVQAWRHRTKRCQNSPWAKCSRQLPVKQIHWATIISRARIYVRIHCKNWLNRSTPKVSDTIGDGTAPVQCCYEPMTGKRY